MPLKPSPSVKPICPYFYECGGCDSQDISYADQTAYKEAWLRDLFASTLQPETAWKPFITSDQTYPVFFRNKLRFSFIRVNGRVWPSRHRKGEEAADIPVDRCFLQSETSNAIINEIARFADAHQWSLYDTRTGSGWLKHVLIRESKSSGKILLSLVTDDQPIPALADWIQTMREKIPQISSLWQSVSWGKNNTDLEDRHLWGDRTLVEKVGDCHFHISPQSFFQTNGSMVETLYSAIAETTKLRDTETLWDLYAGSATIGIFLHRQAGRVVSIEENPSNIRDAELNIKENKVSNLHIVEGMVEKTLTSRIIDEFGPADCIVVDPPRAGLHDTVKRILPHLPDHRLIYVSCNPLTCKRDIEQLTDRGYTLTSVQGIDMFPHSWHCELIAELRIIHT